MQARHLAHEHLDGWRARSCSVRRRPGLIPAEATRQPRSSGTSLQETLLRRGALSTDTTSPPTASPGRDGRSNPAWPDYRRMSRRIPTWLAASTVHSRGVLAVEPRERRHVRPDRRRRTITTRASGTMLVPGTGSACAGAVGFAQQLGGNFARRRAQGSDVVPQGDYNLSLGCCNIGKQTRSLFAGTVDLYRCSLASAALPCAIRPMR